MTMFLDIGVACLCAGLALGVCAVLVWTVGSESEERPR